MSERSELQQNGDFFGAQRRSAHCRLEHELELSNLDDAVVRQ